MEDKIILALVTWWPVTIFVCVAFITPLVLAIANGICSWLDDGDKSFKYPSVDMLPWISFLGEYSAYATSKWDEWEETGSSNLRKFTRYNGKCYYSMSNSQRSDTISMELTISFFIGLALACVHAVDLYVYSSTTEVTLSLVFFFWLSRKVMRLGKSLAKHIKDPHAHKGG